MGYKCCVVGCKSGYNNQDSSGITMHKFPDNEILRKKWVKNLYTTNLVPTKNTRVCSLHFSSTDFIQERRDSNKYRKLAEKELLR